jgi:hypothetical protein
MVPNERRDPPEFETAGVVVHDETQQRQENVFGHGRAVYAGVTGDGAHRSMREAMNESVDESPDGHGLDVIQIASCSTGSSAMMRAMLGSSGFGSAMPFASSERMTRSGRAREICLHARLRGRESESCTADKRVRLA